MVNMKLLIFLFIVIGIKGDDDDNDHLVKSQPINCSAIISSEEEGEENFFLNSHHHIPNCTVDVVSLQNSPITNATFSQDHGEKEAATCFKIRSGVYRIVGEYRAVVINCSATFRLDLDFDGFRPTEAIRIKYWKHVKAPQTKNQNGGNITIQSYGLTVTILSIEALFDEHKSKMAKLVTQPILTRQYLNKNISAPIAYPRTGSYRIRGMFQNSKKNYSFGQKSFYFFIEEPRLNSNLTFMKNLDSHPKLIEPIMATHQVSGDNYFKSKILLVPCRPSHYVDRVRVFYTFPAISKKKGETGPDMIELTQYDEAGVNQKPFYDPTIGFQVPVDLDEEYPFMDDIFCSAKFFNQTFNWTDRLISVNEGSSSAKGVYGDKELAQKSNCLSLTLTNEATETSSTLRCTFNTRPSQEATFLSMGFDTMAYQEIRYSREFAIPRFSHLSYNVQKGTQNPGSYEFRIERGSKTGACFCSTGKIYNYMEYTSGLTIREYKFAPGSDWTQLPFQNTLPEMQIQIRMTRPDPLVFKTFYDYDRYRFVCILASNTVTIPVLWYVRHKNRMEELDHLATEGVSIYEANLTTQIVAISCLASLWQHDTWRQSTQNLTIVVGTPPNITTRRPSMTFHFDTDTTDGVLRCDAEGDPTPHVWWELDSKLVGTPSKGTAYYQLPRQSRESSTVYVCRSKNPYGSQEEKFQVIFGKSQTHTVVIVVVIVVALVVIVLCGIFFYLRSRRERTKILSRIEMYEFKNGVKNNTSNDYSVPLSKPYDVEYEVPKENFTVDKEKLLGSGEFGIVMEGRVRENIVAAKTVRAGADKHYIKSLLSELKIMIYLGPHPFLIKLIGASTQQLSKGIVFVFVELCELGNMLAYLQKNRQSFLPEQTTNQLTTGNATLFCKWAYQIADGMSFLGSKKVIHGDLAARNVLLTADKTAKVTDFGLSRQLYTYSTYMKQNQDPLPFRWMALESLAHLEFSHKSDVWSYGVTLWELYTLGDVPFPGLSWTVDFVDEIRAGLRMKCPTYMPQEMYQEILVPSWNCEPTSRPSFENICHILTSNFGAAASPKKILGLDQQQVLNQLLDETDPRIQRSGSRWGRRTLDRHSSFN